MSILKKPSASMSSLLHWMTLRPGMVAGFPAGVADGHHLVNKTAEDAVYLEVGTRTETEECFYPDIDLHYGPGDEAGYRHKDGTPYDD